MTVGQCSHASFSCARVLEAAGALISCVAAAPCLQVVLHRRLFEISLVLLPLCFVMLRLCALLAPLVVGQTFPHGFETLLSDVQSHLDGIEGLHVDNRVAFQRLAEAAEQEVQSGISRDRETAAQDVAIDAIARQAMAELKYMAGCARTIEGCPAGWTMSEGMCTPPGSYDGPCGATALAALSQGQAEPFAMKCRAGWPCQECSTRFAGCPRGWSAVGRLCLAPPDYDGICSPAMDFATFNDGARARWAAMCGAPWPCA